MSHERIGFIGLGTMGGPMALHVHRCCGPIVVWDRNPTARALPALVCAGATVARSLADLGSQCNVILLCLPDGDAVDDLLFGADGLASMVRPGMLVVDCSTTSPGTSRAASARLTCGFADAPITGEQRRAESGELTCMVGGSDASFKRALPILSAFASKVVHMGTHGNGQLAKALNNCLYNISVAAMAEVLPLAQRSGLSVEAFSRVVAAGTGQSFGFCKFAPLCMDRTFEAPTYGYPMGAAFKDMEVVAEAAEAAGVTLSVVGAARRTYEAALAAGLSHEHKGAMVKVWERELGVVIGGHATNEAHTAVSSADRSRAKQRSKL